MPRVSHDSLSDVQVRQFRPRSRPFDVRDGTQRGLVLTVLPSGRKQWTLRYRAAGKQRRLILGDYPDLTLSRARDEAEDVRIRIRRGLDPAAQRREVKQPARDTVSTLAEEYLKRGGNSSAANEDERILNVDVLPFWGERSVRELTRRDVRALVDRVTDRGSPVMANRVLSLVKKMLDFASSTLNYRQRWRGGSPATATRPRTCSTSASTRPTIRSSGSTPARTSRSSSARMRTSSTAGW